jgi:hypothetical protein
VPSGFAVSCDGHRLFARSKTAGASVGSAQITQRMVSKGTTRGIARSAALTKATLAVHRKGEAIRHLALQTWPAKPARGQIEMHLFASCRPERHTQARRITAGPIPAKHARIAAVALLGKPVSRSGTRTVRASGLSRSRPRDILPRKRRQSEIRTYISRAPPNTALLRLSGQHGAARGAMR